MPQVNSKQAKEFDAAQAKYQEKLSELNEAIEQFNLTIDQEFANEITPKIEAVNEAIADLKQAATDIRDDLQAYFDERTENWQYGEKGQAYGEWIERFGEIEYQIDDVEIDVPEVPQIDEETIDAETVMDY